MCNDPKILWYHSFPSKIRPGGPNLRYFPRGKKRRLGPPELMQRFFRWKSVTPG